MIYSRNGESITADGVTFAVGDRIIATDTDYAGLKGCITEIRTGSDKYTENETDDIYCCFDFLEKEEEMGHYLFKTIKDNNFDDFLIAICGWSLETLMKQALIIPDKESQFHDEIIEAVNLTEWDNGFLLEQPCKINCYHKYMRNVKMKMVYGSKLLHLILTILNLLGTVKNRYSLSVSFSSLQMRRRMRFVFIWDFRKKEEVEMQVKYLKNTCLHLHLMWQIWKHRIMLMIRQSWRLKNKYGKVLMKLKSELKCDIRNN